ncbi:unnamed protein product [Bursaphelenchus okinawaensis]|uniref:Lig_chan-Glu_bd domain-containing protein n=1 Tax=Bursaphelenchus okinawaensis TaxID=465554 RepID=A0A811LA45_9BILA|nr:unnamed protein product [Bursaphelenchus okinawaensis]CAG9119888.1 unnamed protein product [Bursaphelenchus okinawaensis]
MAVEGRKIKVIFPKNPPDVFEDCAQFPTLKPSLRCPFPGRCVEILMQLAEYLHYEVEPFPLTLDRGTVNWGNYRNNTWDGVLGMIANNTADTVCTLYQPTISRREHFALSYPVTSVRPLYIVKRNTDDFSSGLWNAFSPYENTTWLAYLAMFFVQVIFMIFLSRVEIEIGKGDVFSPLETIWKLIRLQLYQPLNVGHFTVAGNWTILVFSMVQCRLFLDMYQNLLLSSLLRPVDRSPFSNADDILIQVQEKKYSFVTNYLGHWYFEEMNMNITTGHMKLLQNITAENKVQLVRTIRQALDLVSTGRYIYPIQEDALEAIIAKDRCDLAYINEGMTERTAHFVFAKDSKVQEEFDRAILQNLDFIRRTHEKYFSEETSVPMFQRHRRICVDSGVDNEMRKPLTMMSIFGIVVIGAGGFLLSGAIFVFELYLFWQKRLLQYKTHTRKVWHSAINAALQNLPVITPKINSNVKGIQLTINNNNS